MKTMKAMMLAVILMSTVGYSADFPVYVPGGFSTGQDYLKMDEAQRRAYAIGALNGITLASFFGAPRDKLQWIESYTQGMTDIQVAAIIYKYIQDNPGRWHDGLNLLTYSAIHDAYRQSRTSE